jgi:GNAT superfamily N-acetyltransferase
MEIGIRTLNNTDCKAIIDLILQIQCVEFSLPIGLADQPDIQDIESYYLRSGGNMWGAFAEDRLVGTIALISTGHQAGAIRKMFVRKEFRGGEWGIAQQLFQALSDYCARNQITDLYLGTVEIFKAAHRFYERNGFRRIDRSDLPGYFPVVKIDDVFYHAHLSN